MSLTINDTTKQGSEQVEKRSIQDTENLNTSRVVPSSSMNVEFIEDGCFGVDYDGIPVIITKEKFNQYRAYKKKNEELKKTISDLQNKLNSTRKEKREWGLKFNELKIKFNELRVKFKKIKSLYNKALKDNEELLAEIKRLKEQNKYLSDMIYSFSKNQNKKLTPEIKDYIRTSSMGGASIKQIHEQLLQTNIDVSYEAVRKVARGEL